MTALHPERQALWSRYEAAELQHVRHLLLRSLDEFINDVLRAPEGEREAFARQLAAEAAEGIARVPIRTPLFRRVI